MKTHPKDQHIRDHMAVDMLLKMCGGLLEQTEALTTQCEFLTNEWAKLAIGLLGERKKRTTAIRFSNKRVTELDNSFKGLLAWQNEQPKKKDKYVSYQ